MKPVLVQGLPAMGVNHHFLHAVAHSPLVYHGLNLSNLLTEQMITHIHTLTKYGSHTDDPTGVLLQASGKLLWLELGLNRPLFNISPHFYPCVTKMWVSQCWFNCVQRGISISLPISDFQPQWEHDRELMAIFLRSARYCDQDLVTLNLCCLYLKAIYLSDICNGLGTMIKQQFWTGDNAVDHYKYHWPQIQKPAACKWAHWQRCLTLSLNLGKQQRLPLPCGRWHSTT